MYTISILLENFYDSNLVTEMINDTLNAIHDYNLIVSKQEHFVMDKSLSKEHIIHLIKTLNNERCILCDDIIGGIKAINRLCSHEGLSKFYEGDEDNKIEMFKFAMEFDNIAHTLVQAI